MDYILFENSAYARLGFTSIDGMNATDADFKSARKKVVLESHSDKLGDVLGRIPTPDEIQAAKERPALANAAYDIVKDPNARKEHDKAILQNPLRKTELTKAVEIFRNARATSAFQDFEAGEALRKKHGFTQDELNIEDKRQADIEARSAQAAAQAVQRSANTGSAFKSAAQTAGAKAQPSAAQQAKEKSEELGRLLGRILNNPKDKDDRTRFLDEVRRVVLDADWLILLAMHNQTPERLTRNNREYRAVLGILAEAMAANSDIAKSKRFTAAIEPFIFAGLDNAPRAPYETQAMDLFKAALAINPEIFSDEGVEAYCRRTHEPYGDKISVDIVLEILKKRPYRLPRKNAYANSGNLRPRFAAVGFIIYDNVRGFFLHHKWCPGGRSVIFFVRQ